MTTEAIDQRATEDHSRLFSTLPETGAEIDLAEAIARAVKYNLDNRMKLMEAVVAQRRLNLTDFDKLPQLAARAGYTIRDNRMPTPA